MMYDQFIHQVIYHKMLRTPEPMTRERRKASARKRRLLPTANVTIRSVKLVEPSDCSRVVLRFVWVEGK